MTLSYAEALDYLFSFINYEQKASYRYAPETFNLSRFQDFLAALGNPHQRYPCIHIAGTKGKGSTAAFCESVLRAAGYRTGLYTSPHLQDFRERVQINRTLIPPEAFSRIVAEIKPVVAEYPGLTWFELVTAVALVYFAQEAVDIAVLEVGLGGRLDATNVVTPRVAILTSISFDHMHLLGHTLGEIAGEKAGIIKPNVPVVSAPQPPAAEAVIRRVATAQNAPLFMVGHGIDVVSHGLIRPEETSFTLRPLWRETPRAEGHDGLPDQPADWTIPLTGEHQVINASVALVALDQLARQGFAIKFEAMQAGLRTVKWPGRFDVLGHAPEVIIDAAHNVDSTERVAQTVATLYPGRPLTLIFGASADKDIPGMISSLVPGARRVILTRAANARAALPTSIAAEVRNYGKQAEVTESADEALELALRGAPPEAVILATGSVYVAGAIADAWQRRAGKV